MLSAKGVESVDGTYVDDSWSNSEGADEWFFLCKSPTQRVHSCLQNGTTVISKAKRNRDGHIPW